MRLATIIMGPQLKCDGIYASVLHRNGSNVGVTKYQIVEQSKKCWLCMNKIVYRSIGHRDPWMQENQSIILCPKTKHKTKRSKSRGLGFCGRNSNVFRLVANVQQVHNNSRQFIHECVQPLCMIGVNSYKATRFCSLSLSRKVIFHCVGLKMWIECAAAAKTPLSCSMPIWLRLAHKI